MFEGCIHIYMTQTDCLEQKTERPKLFAATNAVGRRLERPEQALSRVPNGSESGTYSPLDAPETAVMAPAFTPCIVFIQPAG